MMSTAQLDYEALEFCVQAFDVILIITFILLGLTSLTAKLSSRISRSKTWYLFIGSTMFWCIAYLLLLGRQGNRDPAFGICLLQSALVYAANPIATISALGLALELHMKLNILSFSDKRLKEWQSWFLAAPPAVGLVVFFYVLGIGAAHPDAVQRDSSRIFCHIPHIDGFGIGQPFVISAVTTMIPDALVLLFSGLVAIKVCISKRRYGQALPPSGNARITVSWVIRVTALTVLLSIGNVMAITSLVMTTSTAGWNLALTSMPVSVVLVFGTQMDFLHTWCCRHKASRGESRKEAKGLEMAISVRPSPSRIDLLRPCEDR
ncbi:uncharacterized protein EV420DRAFT_1568733 [Desarmillaria tabescens]|uniref:G-protein coupled receptors family 2 profile 2 domain-containing protein n=1 Tax=Armillaria tabescens TaxID=1929756 RepID=A0AA39JVQ2_ARMTA|nr:uncharacterized protein EV420DRAFT_1568733 [Desarmillaria tabescens]KAK0447433.1 hypothetical protein EV420DRAFT_1568733 [Desarmillaria tabescens]